MERQPTEYTGIEFLLFKRASEIIGWTSEAINWQCLPTYEELTLSLKEGTCDVGMGRLSASKDMMDSGVTTSWPISKTYLSIVVIPDKKTSGFFSFLRPFDWVVWVMMILTAVVVGLLAWGFDWYELKYGPSAEHALRIW